MNMTIRPLFFQPLIDRLGDYPYILAVCAALITIIAAYLFTTIIKVVLSRFVERTAISVDDEIVRIIGVPTFYSIIMVGFSVSATLLPISAKLQDSIVAALKGLGILIWTVFLIRLAKIVLRSWAKGAKEASLVRPQTLPVFENLALIIVLSGAIFLIFQTWQIDMTAWLASAGVMGIAIGFASKDTLSNLISGVFILADAPYKIGDYVVLDSGERGEITNIGVRSTRMLTRDDVELTIPNAIMGNTKIINESGGPHKKYRIRVPVGVAYGSDIDKVSALLMDVVRQTDKVCVTPEARVRFRAFGNSSLDFELLCWVEEPALRGLVTHILLGTIYTIFNREGVEIPYSKQDLYIKELPDSLQR